MTIYDEIDVKNAHHVGFSLGAITGIFGLLAIEVLYLWLNGNLDYSCFM